MLSNPTLYSHYGVRESHCSVSSTFGCDHALSHFTRPALNARRAEFDSQLSARSINELPTNLAPASDCRSPTRSEH